MGGVQDRDKTAVAGGTTTIVDMPLNSIPPTVSVRALSKKRAAAEGKLSADVAFWGGLIPGSEAQIGPLVAEGVCGFKSFLVDSGVEEFPLVSPSELASALPLLRDLEVPALVHAEDPARILRLLGIRPTTSGIWRPDPPTGRLQRSPRSQILPGPPGPGFTCSMCRRPRR